MWYGTLNGNKNSNEKTVKRLNEEIHNSSIHSLLSFSRWMCDECDKNFNSLYGRQQSSKMKLSTILTILKCLFSPSFLTNFAMILRKNSALNFGSMS
jgi:transposase-like protein